MNTQTMVLIVSPPRDLQIGIQALLTTHLDVDVLVVGEGSSALKVIERHKPVLIILDQDIPGNTVAKLVHDVKTKWPEIIWILMVNDDGGRQSFKGTGADLVIIKGFPGAKLVAEIKNLLDRKERNH